MLGRKNTTTRWVAGFQMFENKPVVVEAKFVETDKMLALVREDSANYREAYRLLGDAEPSGKVLFKKNSAEDMRLLFNTEQEAISDLLIRQRERAEVARKRAELENEILGDLRNSILSHTWKSLCTL